MKQTLLIYQLGECSSTSSLRGHLVVVRPGVQALRLRGEEGPHLSCSCGFIPSEAWSCQGYPKRDAVALNEQLSLCKPGKFQLDVTCFFSTLCGEGVRREPTSAALVLVIQVNRDVSEPRD